MPLLVPLAFVGALWRPGDRHGPAEPLGQAGLTPSASPG